MTIEGLGNPVDKKCCTDRLIECRDWIDSELQKVLDKSNADYETKKLIADVASNLVLYTQECSSANFNYTHTCNKD